MVNNPQSITQNNYGTENPRISVNSTDNSSNVIVHGPVELFKQISDEIEKQIPDESSRSELKDSLQEIQRASSKASAYERYAEFIALVANHASLLPILAPYLSQLTHWISTLQI